MNSTNNEMIIKFKIFSRFSISFLNLSQEVPLTFCTVHFMLSGLMRISIAKISIYDFSD